MCIDDENVWCLGSEEGPTYGHIFAPFLLDPAVALARCRARAKLPEAARRKQAEEAARLERAEKATREFVLAHSDLVEGTAAFNAAVTAAREFAKTSREFKGHGT